MTSAQLAMRCQRCGTGMEMRDPLPDGPWRPDQFWVCPKCGRHFWTTHANPPKPAAAEPQPEAAAKAGAGLPPPVRPEP